MAGTRNSGRRGIASQLHVLRGTWRRDRHADVVAPEPPKGRPTPSRALEGVALAEWNRMLDCLEESGMLTVADGAALYQYARLFAETEQHGETHAEVGASIRILENNIGRLKGDDLTAGLKEIGRLRRVQASYASQIRSGRMGLRQWLVEFGLTPSARSRVKLPAQKPRMDPLKAKYFTDSTEGKR